MNSRWNGKDPSSSQAARPGRPLLALLLLLVPPAGTARARGPALPPRSEGPPRRERDLGRIREEAAWAWARGDQARLLEEVRLLEGASSQREPFLFLLAGIRASRGPAFRRDRALELCRRFLAWYPPAREEAWRSFLESLPPPLARDLPQTALTARNLARAWREDLQGGRSLLWAAHRKTLAADLGGLARRVESLEKRIGEARRRIAFHRKKEKAWRERLRKEWKPRRGRIQGWSGDWIADHVRLHRQAAEKEEKKIRAWREKKALLEARIRAVREKLEEYRARREERTQASSSPARTDQRRAPSPSKRWIRSPARSSR